MQLIYLTAYQFIPLGPPIDLAVETWRLDTAMREALAPLAITTRIIVHYLPHTVAAYAYVPDADAAFERLAPVFRGWPHCGQGFVLLRYGAPGARECQVSLAEDTMPIPLVA